MHFDYRGLKTQEEIEVPAGFVENYVRLGIPSAIFLLAVYFLLSAGKRAEYSIIFPHMATRKRTEITLGAHDLERAWADADRKLGGHRLPAYPEEIGAQIAALRRENGKGIIPAEPNSLLRALRQLAKQGKFCDCEGLYLPSLAKGEFSAKQLYALRLLHDTMLEHGLAFKRKKTIWIRGGDLQLCLFSGKKNVLLGIGKKKRAVIFDDRAALLEFEKSLWEYEPENIRVKMALSNNKIFFLAAAKKELEAILP